MRYITYKRFKGTSILNEQCNIPYGSECKLINNMIYYNKRPVCYATSQNGRDCFTRNDDNQGLLRGKLITAIMNKLRARDDKHDERWRSIFDDTLCQPLQNENITDRWLWNDKFYTADISLLKHIAGLIDLKERDYNV